MIIISRYISVDLGEILHKAQSVAQKHDWKS